MHNAFCRAFTSEHLTSAGGHLAYAVKECNDFVTAELAHAGIDPWLLLGGNSAASSEHGVDHLGQDCQYSCDAKRGACNFCGPMGACCMKSYPDAPRECGFGTLGCDSHYCCVKGDISASSTLEWPATPVTPLHFFGIAEEYDASVCLYWYQAGIYTRETWAQSKCTCTDRGQLRASLGQFDVAWTRSKGGKRQGRPSTQVDVELNVSKQDMELLNTKDTRFYAAARKEFARRVALVEQHVGHHFMNCGS